VLVDHFLARYSEELASRRCFIAQDTMERLLAYPWPGNVRELENAIKRALVLASGEVLAPADFDFLEEGRRRESEGPSFDQLVRDEVTDALEGAEGEDLYRGIIERVERPLLDTVLARTEGNQIRAAALLGINRNTLRKKISELGIRLPGKGRD
jgi:two-component system nitrogen regulation response regulator GlnG